MQGHDLLFEEFNARLIVVRQQDTMLVLHSRAFQQVHGEAARGDADFAGLEDGHEWMPLGPLGKQALGSVVDELHQLTVEVAYLEVSLNREVDVSLQRLDVLD